MTSKGPKLISNAALPGMIIFFGYCAIFFAYHRLPTFLAGVLFGHPDSYPFSFQMGMWLPFFLGIYLLLDRYLDHRIGREFFENVSEPVSENMVLESAHFAKIIEKVKPLAHHPIATAPRVIYQVVLKYQASKSVEQASSMLASLTELALHRLDIKFSSIRYLSWLIPSLGFMGTVYGISLSVGVIGTTSPDDPSLLSNIAANLAVAFDTTLLALIQSAVLVYLSGFVEAKEEKAINEVGEYVLENLINRLA